VTSGIQIEIPPRPEYVGVVRLALASLARKAGFDEERVDELRIAVSEACTSAVMAATEADITKPVCVSWSEEDDRVVVEVSGDLDAPGASSGETPVTLQLSSRLVMAEALLRTLADDYEAGSDKVSLTFSLP
jgi:serine/threonine-protein kinase RsbW